MPARALPPMPDARGTPRPYVLAIVHEQTGRIVRKVRVSEATMRKIVALLDGAGELVNAAGDVVRAVSAIGEVFDRLAPPPRRLPARGRR